MNCSSNREYQEHFDQNVNSTKQIRYIYSREKLLEIKKMMIANQDREFFCKMIKVQ